MEWAEVVAIPAEELEANAVRDLERLTRLKAHHAPKGLPSGLTNTPPSYFVEPDQQSNPPGTIKVILTAANQRGRSKASVLDGTILISSSRQAFLDSARALIRAGYDPDNWLEAWRVDSTEFVLRARLRTAALLTIDDRRTILARWKPFSPSAVALSIRQNARPLPDPAQPPEALHSPSARGAARRPGSDTQPLK